MTYRVQIILPDGVVWARLPEDGPWEMLGDWERRTPEALDVILRQFDSLESLVHVP